MDNTLLYVIALAVAVLCGFFCYRTAEGRGRSGIGFGRLGFFLPLIGLIVVLVISPKPTASQS